MSADFSSMSVNKKLQLAFGSGARDNGSLHRWVLLKNSIIRSLPTLPTVSAPEPEPETEQDEEHDAFMFPDAGKLTAPQSAGLEQQWFESLFETLDHDDDDMDEPQLPALPDSEEDEDLDDCDECLFSPSTSPMSSSDDLMSSPVYCPPPIALPYPIPYPPYHPPLLVDVPPSRDSFFTAFDPDDLPVPDAIPDESDVDDDSDALSTPSLIRSSTLLHRRHPLHDHQQPHVVDPEDDAPYFSDGLPFPLEQAALYSPQEC